MYNRNHLWFLRDSGIIDLILFVILSSIILVIILFKSLFNGCMWPAFEKWLTADRPTRGTHDPSTRPKLEMLEASRARGSSSFRRKPKKVARRKRPSKTRRDTSPEDIGTSWGNFKRKFILFFSTFRRISILLYPCTPVGDCSNVDPLMRYDGFYLDQGSLVCFSCGQAYPNHAPDCTEESRRRDGFPFNENPPTAVSIPLRRIVASQCARFNQEPAVKVQTSTTPS